MQLSEMDGSLRVNKSNENHIHVFLIKFLAFKIPSS